MRQTAKAQHLGSEQGALPRFFHQIALRLRGELLRHDEQLPSVPLICLFADFLYAAHGFARACPADDKPQSHMLRPFRFFPP